MPILAHEHAFWTVVFSLCRGFGYLCLAAAGWVVLFWAWNLGDPPKPLEISEATTVITDPIGLDGRPNFAKSLLSRIELVSSPNENSAVLMWEAVGDGLLSDRHRFLLFEAIGTAPPDNQRVLSQFPDEEDLYAVAGNERLALRSLGAGEWLLASKSHLLRMASRRPWPAKLPASLADWVASNEKPIDLLVMASQRPGFYSPPPGLLGQKPCLLIDADFPSDQARRESVYALLARAMHQLSRTDRRGALIDINAALSFSQRSSCDELMPSVLTSLEGLSLSFRALHAWLDGADRQEVERMIQQLDDQPEPLFVSHALRTGEKLAIVEFAIDEISSRKGNQARSSIDTDIRFEPNVVLRNLCNRLSEADRITEQADVNDRLESMAFFEQSIKSRARASQESPVSFIARALFSRRQRSILKSDALLSGNYPPVTNAMLVEVRTATQQRLTLLAAALKLHQLRHGEFPETLDALTPEPLAELPLDPFTNKPFVYEKRGAGFAIWSLGRNGVDDNGSDPTGEFVDGDYAPIDWTGERPKPLGPDDPEGPDDIVVRLPVPTLELPGVAP